MVPAALGQTPRPGQASSTAAQERPLPVRAPPPARKHASRRQREFASAAIQDGMSP